MTSGFMKCRDGVVGALKLFIRRCVEEQAYDYIVPIERKGTAILRAIYGDLQDVWQRVVSDGQICNVLEGKDSPRVLIIEDAARTGGSVSRLRDRILQVCPSAKVTGAAFVSLHKAEGALDRICFPSLDYVSYRDVREIVIDYLRSNGSLLLDTEHPEIIAYPASKEEFARALAGWGTTVRFTSPPATTNLTVCRELLGLKPRLEDLLPSYATLEGGFCKVRAVESPNDPSAFAIVPICFPQISFPVTQNEQPLVYRHPRMKWPEKVQGAHRVFHCVGICLSLEILIDLIESLLNALGDRIRFDNTGGQLRHLVALFPELEIGEMTKELGRPWDVRRRAKKAKMGTVDDPGVHALDRLADGLFRECFDPRAYENGFVGSFDYHRISKVARELGDQEPRVSAALDILIDRSWLEPEIAEQTAKGIKTLWRAFSPDGEAGARRLLRLVLAEPPSENVLDD